jgi:hypothetical protein
VGSNDWSEDRSVIDKAERGSALAEARGTASFENFIRFVNDLEVKMLRAPTREGGHAERAAIAQFAATHLDGHRVINEMATRDWAASALRRSSPPEGEASDDLFQVTKNIGAMLVRPYLVHASSGTPTSRTSVVSTGDRSSRETLVFRD